MDKKEFAKGIKILELAYNQKFDEDKLEFWYRQLQDMNADRYFNNIKTLIKSNTFMPNIAQIRNETISKQYNNYEQRDYSGVDFDKLFANSMEEMEIANENHIPMI